MPEAEEYENFELFSKRISFSGRFISEGVVEGNFSIELSYSEINIHAPRGIARGSVSDHKRLERFFLTSSRPQRLESESSAVGREHISATIIIRSVSFKNYADDEVNYINQIIARFEVLELDIVKELRASREGIFRNITFFVSGAYNEWATLPLRRLSFDGNIRTEHENSERRIQGGDDVKMSVKDFYFYEGVNFNKIFYRDLNDGKRKSLKRKILSEYNVISISIDEKISDRSEEDFLKRSLDISNCMCVLTSFLAKSTTNWFKYVYFDSCFIKEHFKNIEFYPDLDLRHEEHVISVDEIPKFLEEVLELFIENKSNGFDLTLPILTYVSGHEAKFISDSLKNFYNATEQMVALATKELTSSMILSQAQIEDLVKISESFLKEKSVNPEYYDVIVSKIRRISDGGIRDKLTSLANVLNINLDDIGGISKLRKSFMVRNKLIHSHTEQNITDVVAASDFMETLSEMLIISLLGWKGAVNIPTLNNRYLSDKD